MDARLERIRIENFKSLKEFEIELGQFNVLIGPNGSGKTNVLEAFKFIQLCIDPPASPSYPFSPWWGFNNIVWSKNEELPINFSLRYSVCGIAINYTCAISGTGNKFSFLSEKCHMENMAYIKRDPVKFTLVIDEKFATANHEEIKPLETEKFSKFITRPSAEFERQITPDRSIIQLMSQWFSVPLQRDKSDKSSICMCIPHDGFEHPKEQFPPAVISPNLFDQDDEPHPLYYTVGNLLSWTGHTVFLRHINFNALRQPVSLMNGKKLAEDGSGLINLLFSWYMSNGGRLPDGIILALDELFPGWQITFDTADDGRVMMTVLDGGLSLLPPSIPDGLYKALAILAAIELNPRMILIDEIDTSLHSKLINYLISVLKTAKPTVIITTHSPLAIDSVDLEDLILLERADGQTRSHRIQNPNDVRLKLNEMGVTPSESWIYGEL